MDRDKYLKLCQNANVKLKQKPKWELKDEDYCTYNGTKYVPSAYILTFDVESKPIHLCKLIDVNANSTITVNLKDVI